MGTKKPPLGVKPYYVSSLERIEELNSAISRYVSDTTVSIDVALLHDIEMWANEIEMQCKLIRELDKSERDRLKINGQK